ncbi:MAG TPA: thioesterase family protein [Bacillota bacterium]|nr:thioesterase family protein [Bacillota bacterium]
MFELISYSKQRVRYSETDAMGVVYYSNYLAWFEVGRTDWFRETGRTYRMLEEEGIILPVVEAHCRYVSSAQYDDSIVIITEWQDSPDIYFTFQYKVVREPDQQLLAEGWTKHLCVNHDGHIQRGETKRLKESCRKLNLPKA